MALTFDGISPTAITFDGEDVNELRYGSTFVWGKPFSLTISQGANTTVTVTRTESPNQHAELIELSNGSVIYYEDNLKITASASSGYTLTFKVNGTLQTSNSITTGVWGAVSIETSASASASWHTIYTGSSTAKNETIGTTSTITLSPAITIPSTATKVRITGSYCSQAFIAAGDEVVSFTDTVITISSIFGQTTKSFTDYVKLIVKKGASLSAKLVSGSDGFSKLSSITITKCEAYY